MVATTVMERVRDIVGLKELFFDLPESAQDDLKNYLRTLGDPEIREAGTLEEVFPRSSDLLALRESLTGMHATAMREGFVVVRAVPGLSFEQRFAVGWIFATLLGEPLVQKLDSGARHVMVYDRDGKSMKQGARYHQSRDGGSIHTDNVNNPTPWRTMVLACVQPANGGGENIFVDGHDVLGYLDYHNPAALETLSQEFWFDGRGFDQVFSCPILFRNGDDVKIRYLREYIEAGHERRGEPLTEQQVQALDALDAALTRSQLQLRYRMNAGDVTIINDSRMFHGRTRFQDHSPPQVHYDPRSQNRLFTRIWVND